MAAVAQRLWWSLAAADWLEAFAAHPRIGEHAAVRLVGAGTGACHGNQATPPARGWSPGIARTKNDSATRSSCVRPAKSAEEILVILEQRLHNEPEDELQIAADEQRKITELRLNKLITS